MPTQRGPHPPLDKMAFLLFSNRIFFIIKGNSSNFTHTIYVKDDFMSAVDILLACALNRPSFSLHAHIKFHSTAIVANALQNMWVLSKMHWYTRQIK